MAMSQQHKNLLTRNRLRLVRDLFLSQEFFTVLQSNYTLTVSMVEEIESVKTTQGKAGKLLDILPKRGSVAFDTFIEALFETHQESLAELLGAPRPPSSPSSDVRVIAQPKDSGPGGDQLTPSATSSSIDQPSATRQPQQPSDEPSDDPPSSKGKVHEQWPGHENASSKTQSVNIDGWSDVEEITRCVHTSQHESFIFNLYSPEDGGQPGKTESLSNGRCIVFRNNVIKKYGYAPNFDDVNLIETFKKFGIKVESTLPLTSPENTLDRLRVQTEIDASALFLFVFAPGSGDIIVTDDGKFVLTFEILDIVKKSVALKGRPKVVIFHLTNSGSVDHMDSVAEPAHTAPTLEMSGLSLGASDDNLAVLKVTSPPPDEQKIHWLVSSLIFLMTKYSKTHDLDKILDRVKRILDKQEYSVKLSSNLNHGLYFTS